MTTTSVPDSGTQRDVRNGRTSPFASSDPAWDRRRAIKD